MGCGADLSLEIWIFEHFATSKMSDNVLLDTSPLSRYVVNVGADNKLNSMDSVLAKILEWY